MNAPPLAPADQTRPLRRGFALEYATPTHPHPGMETATKNMLIGPFVSVADRTQDLVRMAMSR
jgi:hypothetical protein